MPAYAGIQATKGLGCKTGFRRVRMTNKLIHLTRPHLPTLTEKLPKLHRRGSPRFPLTEARTDEYFWNVTPIVADRVTCFSRPVGSAATRIRAFSTHWSCLGAQCSYLVAADRSSSGIRLPKTCGDQQGSGHHQEVEL